MGRLFKSGLDYFPLDTKMDGEIELIESEHGIKGFGVLLKLYQKIYANNYWIEWSKKEEIVFSSRINVNKNEVNDIINSCLEWEIFDKKCFEKYRILTSKGIQKRYFKIIERRKEVDVVPEITLVDYKEILKESKINVNIKPINVDSGTQSKVKESKKKVNIPQNEFAEQAQDEFYETKKGRKLSGKRLESFLRFWECFDYKKGKAEAADSWYEIPQLTNEIVDRICFSAEKEAKNRSDIIKKGMTPKFAQGWLSARRWEDEEYQLENKEKSATLTAMPGAISV